MKEKNITLKVLTIVITALTVQSAIYATLIDNSVETIILAVTGLILGILMLVKKQGKAFGIIAICLSVIALIIGFGAYETYNYPDYDYVFEEESYKIGEIFTLSNGVQYKVTEFKRLEKEDDNEKEYGIVNMLITNDTQDDATYEQYDFFMENKDGDLLDTVYEETNNYIKVTGSRNVKSGDSIVVTMAFEINKKDEEFVLCNCEQLGKTGMKCITIEIN